MEPPSVVIPEANIDRLQRVRVSRQMTCDEKERRGDDDIAWMMDYFKGCGHSYSWAMLGHLIDNGVLNIMLTPWLCHC